MSLIGIVKDVGVLASAILGIITLTTTMVKPLRRKMMSCVKKMADVDSINSEIMDLKESFITRNECLTEAINLIREENKKQTEVLESLKDDIKASNQANKAALGNSIKHIYYKYSDEKILPVHEIEALYLLHDAYKREGGNSFVDGIFNEMIDDWQHTVE